MMSLLSQVVSLVQSLDVLSVEEGIVCNELAAVPGADTAKLYRDADKVRGLSLCVRARIVLAFASCRYVSSCALLLRQFLGGFNYPRCL